MNVVRDPSCFGGSVDEGFHQGAKCQSKGARMLAQMGVRGRPFSPKTVIEYVIRIVVH